MTIAMGALVRAGQAARVWQIPRGASRGVERLGLWMIDAGDALADLYDAVPQTMIDRILQGEVIPESEAAEGIGRATRGAVREADFHRRGLWPADKSAVAALAAGAVEAKALADDGAKGVLGETPAGPLFAAVRDGDAVEIHGLGVALRVSVAASIALQAALAQVNSRVAQG
jgi:hypothetical protein